VIPALVGIEIPADNVLLDPRQLVESRRGGSAPFALRMSHRRPDRARSSSVGGRELRTVKHPAEVDDHLRVDVLAVRRLQHFGLADRSPRRKTGTGVRPMVVFAAATGLRPSELFCIEPLRDLYDLRHTYATFALRAGLSVFAVSRFMGLSIAMIDHHYSHLARDSRQHAVSLLDARKTKELISGKFVKPSDGLEPSTPSLP
jgi:hypothetical protein